MNAQPAWQFAQPALPVNRRKPAASCAVSAEASPSIQRSKRVCGETSVRSKTVIALARVSGVARAYNFYPTPPLRTEDGVAAVALGLGRTVVEGERCLSFSPQDPRHILQFSSVDDILANSQREFWALEMDPRSEDGGVGAVMRETRCGLEIAERDGTLAALGSTYSPENHAIYDGLSRPGVRLVTFAPVLKHGAFPLAAILAELLEVGSRGMNRPAEIEFAVRLSEDPDAGDAGRRFIAPRSSNCARSEAGASE